MELLTGQRKRRFKEASYGMARDVAQFFADWRRLEIADLLMQRGWAPHEISAEVELDEDATRRELHALEQAGFARRAAADSWTVDDPSVIDLLVAVQALARRDPRMAEIQREFMPNRSALTADEAETLMDRVARGEVLLLDVRPPIEHEACHVDGSLQAPLASLSEVAKTLPAGVEVVTHCRGAFCCWADAAAEQLRENGIRARSVDAGAHELKRARSGV